MNTNEKDAILEIINIVDSEAFKAENGYARGKQRFEQKPDLCNTQFGERFLKRVGLLIRGKTEYDTCILCGKYQSDNKVVCHVCMENLVETAREYEAASTYTSIPETKVKASPQQKEPAKPEQKEYSKAPAPNVTTSYDGTGNMETFQKEWAARLHAETKASDRYTEDLIKNLDASMDRLASKRSVRHSNRMLMAILVICLMNTISIIAIAIIVLDKLHMIGW